VSSTTTSEISARGQLKYKTCQGATLLTILHLKKYESLVKKKTPDGVETIGVSFPNYTFSIHISYSSSQSQETVP
jgi:hypothetical protein